MAEDTVNPEIQSLTSWLKDYLSSPARPGGYTAHQGSVALGRLGQLTGLQEKGMGIEAEEKKTATTEAGATERTKMTVAPHMGALEQSQGLFKGRGAIQSVLDRLKMGLSGNSLISGQAKLPEGFDSSTYSMIWDTPVNTVMAKSYGWL